VIRAREEVMRCHRVEIGSAVDPFLLRQYMKAERPLLGFNVDTGITPTCWMR